MIAQEKAEDQSRDPGAERIFVIIGAGASGNAAAETLRKEGFQGRIVMVTKEDCLPYDRTQLSKAYLKSDQPAPPILKSEEFYKEKDIEILTGCEALRIDRSNKTVELDNGSYLKYDRLLLATGGTARCLNIPGSKLQNIFTLRNLDDADRIKAVAKKGSRSVVIGASFIGMEIAATFTELGISVTIVAPESVPFELILGEEIGTMYKELHEENGVSFKLGTVVSRFEGAEKVEKVVLENGDVLDADFVLLGVGVQPATGCLEGVELNPDGGVSVDEHFRVTDDIYAAGDIASFIDGRTGGRVRIEHWRLAGEQGRIAARNMLGKKAGFNSIPLFWTVQYGINLRYIGYVKDWDEIIFHGDPADRNFVAFYVKQNKVLAVAGCGSKMKTSTIAKLMNTNQMPTPDELRNGAIDLEKRSGK